MSLENVLSDKKIAFDAIPVFKVCIPGKEKNVLFPPFRNGFSYTIGKAAYSDLRKFRNTVEEGIHSFAYYEDAAKCYSCNSDATIYHAVIPQFSNYYEGTFQVRNGVHVKAYASDALIVTRKVTFFEDFKYFVKWVFKK